MPPTPRKATHDELIKALKKSAQSIEQLCGMVNSYSNKLGLGKKVNAEDWIDQSNCIELRKVRKSRQSLTEVNTKA